MQTIKLGDIVSVERRGKKDRKLVLRIDAVEKIREGIKGVRILIDDVKNEVSFSRGLDGYVAVAVSKYGDAHVYVGERWGVIHEWEWITVNDFDMYKDIPILYIDNGEAVIPWQDACKMIRSIYYAKRFAQNK